MKMANNIMSFTEWMMYNYKEIYFALWVEYEAQKEE